MPKVQKSVVVATDEELGKKSYRNRLKLAVYNAGIGQREWPTMIQDAMLRACIEEIELRYANGREFVIPLVDDVWEGNERYVREFLVSRECIHPEKDRLIDLYFRIMMPDVARHFGR